MYFEKVQEWPCLINKVCSKEQFGVVFFFLSRSELRLILDMSALPSSFYHNLTS